MSGTIRTFDDDMQQQVNEHVTTTTEHIAHASGAEADVSIVNNYATTVNDPALTQQMLPTLKRVAPKQPPSLDFYMPATPPLAFMATLEFWVRIYRLRHHFRRLFVPLLEESDQIL